MMRWLLAGAIAACGGAPSPGRTLHVAAASSLTEAFRDLEGAFEEAHPDVDVALTFAGSQILRLQIAQGAAADVYASADPTHVQGLAGSGRIAWSQVFARNELVVIVPLDNPAGIARFEDLPRAERLVIGTEEVPVGRYTRAVLEAAGATLGATFAAEVRARVVSEENNVRLVRAKVELGEADAAIVYRTDATASARVLTVPIPPELNARADYPIAVVEGTRNRDLADAWMAFVASREGQALLERHGFLPLADPL